MAKLLNALNQPQKLYIMAEENLIRNCNLFFFFSLSFDKLNPIHGTKTVKTFARDQ